MGRVTNKNTQTRGAAADSSHERAPHPRASSTQSMAVTPHCTSIGAVHRNGPHSIVSAPRALPLETIEIVNFSTGVASVSVFMGAMPRSCEPSYSVPHCPVCRFTIKSAPFVRGTVHNVYVPAGTRMPARVMGADVVNCVAALAPVRHTRSYGRMFPKQHAPAYEGPAIVDGEGRVADAGAHGIPHAQLRHAALRLGGLEPLGDGLDVGRRREAAHVHLVRRPGARVAEHVVGGVERRLSDPGQPVVRDLRPATRQQSHHAMMQREPVELPVDVELPHLHRVAGARFDASARFNAAAK